MSPWTVIRILELARKCRADIKHFAIFNQYFCKPLFMLLFSHFLRLLTRPSFFLTSHPYFRGLSLIMSLLFSLLSIFQFSISRYLISMHVSINLYFSLSLTLTLSSLSHLPSFSHLLSLSLPISYTLSLPLTLSLSFSHR